MTVLSACTGHGMHMAAHTSEASAAPAAQADSRALAKTADIPEGGGKIFADRKIVVVQPVAGRFRAFSATCTHQGCTVDNVTGGMINCPCHGSMFNLDGTVMGGPATEPLPEVGIKVDGDTISLA
jgi:Rieske Fe-S protein